MKKLLFSIFALIAFAGFAYAAGPLSGPYEVTDMRFYRSGQDITQENADYLPDNLGQMVMIEQYDNTIIFNPAKGGKIVAFKTGENRYELEEDEAKMVFVFSGTKCTITAPWNGSGTITCKMTLRKLH